MILFSKRLFVTFMLNFVQFTTDFLFLLFKFFWKMLELFCRLKLYLKRISTPLSQWQKNVNVGLHMQFECMCYLLLIKLTECSWFSAGNPQGRITWPIPTHLCRGITDHWILSWYFIVSNCIKNSMSLVNRYPLHKTSNSDFAYNLLYILV